MAEGIDVWNDTALAVEGHYVGAPDRIALDFAPCQPRVVLIAPAAAAPV